MAPLARLPALAHLLARPLATLLTLSLAACAAATKQAPLGGGGEAEGGAGGGEGGVGGAPQGGQGGEPQGGAGGQLFGGMGGQGGQGGALPPTCPAACGENATCDTTQSPPKCECDEGWVGNGFTCLDVDECALEPGPCDEHATCLDLEGSFECECLPGWQGDGLACADVDECADPLLDPCHPYATCENTEGGVLCECLPGFDGDGLSCTAIPFAHAHSAGPGLALAIVDNAYDGTLASMTCVSLSVGSVGADLVSEVEVGSLGLVHGWVGDLVVKLVSPAGTVLTLLSRPGYNEPQDDGNGCCGEDSDLAYEGATGAGALSFSDLAATSAELLGAGLSGSGKACLDDGVCALLPSPGKGPGLALSDFYGENAVGTWQVCVGDAGSSFAGTFQQVTLELVTVAGL
jgi:subtilisin-like proprotein convertase family protein